MASEKYANNAVTTLNGTINNSTTTVVVTSASLFPAAQFRIIIESEIMLVTTVAGTTFTVTRAVDGTSAASHTTGLDVTHILTKAALDQIIADNCQYDVVANLPSAEKAGRLYIASDTLIFYRDTGGAWTTLPLADIAKVRKHLFLGL